MEIDEGEHALHEAAFNQDIKKGAPINFGVPYMFWAE